MQGVPGPHLCFAESRRMSPSTFIVYVSQDTGGHLGWMQDVHVHICVSQDPGGRSRPYLSGVQFLPMSVQSASSTFLQQYLFIQFCSSQKSSKHRKL